MNVENNCLLAGSWSPGIEPSTLIGMTKYMAVTDPRGEYRPLG
jgi:hypothetical protein